MKNNFTFMIPEDNVPEVMKEPEPMTSQPISQPDFEERGSAEAVNALYTALSIATASFGEIKKTEEVKVDTKGGGSYKFRYAPLENLIEATRKPLCDNGLIVMMPFIRTMEDVTKQILIIAHKGGARLIFTFPFHASDDPKQFGGQTTYFQRYAYRSALCLSADSDLDEMPVEKRGETGVQRQTGNKPVDKNSGVIPRENPFAGQPSQKDIGTTGQQNPATNKSTGHAPVEHKYNSGYGQLISDIKAAARACGLQKVNELSAFVYGALWQGEVRFLGEPFLSTLTADECNTLLKKLTDKRAEQTSNKEV